MLNILIMIVVIGFILWAVNRFIPMQNDVKMILNAVVVIALIVWVLKALNFWNYLTRLHF